MCAFLPEVPQMKPEASLSVVLFVRNLAWVVWLLPHGRHGDHVTCLFPPSRSRNSSVSQMLLVSQRGIKKKARKVQEYELLLLVLFTK